MKRIRKERTLHNSLFSPKQCIVNGVNTQMPSAAFHLSWACLAVICTYLKSTCLRAINKHISLVEKIMRVYRIDKGVSASVILPLAIATAFFALSFAGSAEAGSLHVLINGKSIHLSPPPASAPAGYTFNEKNWGAGLQYDFDPWHGHWIPFVGAAEFIDSNSNISYYAGGGIFRRFMISQDLDKLHCDAGMMAFLMTRKGFRKNKPFPGILPVISVGTEHVSINATYVPRVDPTMVHLFFFQLKVKVLEF